MVKISHNCSAAPKLRSGGFYSRLTWITLGAALLRLIVIIELFHRCAGTILTPPPVTDMATYIALAREIAAGSFKGGFYYQPLYYAGFLAPLFRFFPGDAGIIAAVALQWLISTATVALVGLIGRRIFGRRAGLIAAALAGLSAVLMLYVPFLLNETLEAGLLTLVLYLTLRLRWGKTGVARLLGIVVALLVLTRGNTLLLLVPILFYWGAKNFSRCRKTGKRGALTSISVFKQLYVVTMGFWLVFLPFCLFNYYRQGVFFPSSAGNAVLALGNTPEAPPGGRNFGLPAGPMEYPESYQIAMERARAGESVGKQMWNWLIAEPGSFLELQFRKFLLFWDCREIPNNISIYGEGQCSRVIKILSPGGINWLMILAVSGIFFFLPHLLRRRRPDLGLLYGITLIFVGAVCLFYILCRFRLPILPVLAVFAGGFLAFASWRNAATRGALLAALLGGLWLSLFSFDFYRYGLEAAVIRQVRPQGVTLTSDPESIRFDHGPFSMGDWQEIPLKPGFEFTKFFAEPAPTAGVGEWSIFAAAPATLTWRSDSGRIQTTDLMPGLNLLKAEISPGQISASLKVLEFSGDAVAAWDGLRRYDRSQLNGEFLPGELVMRCRFPLVKIAR